MLEEKEKNQIIINDISTKEKIIINIAKLLIKFVFIKIVGAFYAMIQRKSLKVIHNQIIMDMPGN